VVDPTPFRKPAPDPESEFATPPEMEAAFVLKQRRDAATRRYNNPLRKMGFAHVSEDMFSAMPDPAMRLWLTCLMHSNFPSTRNRRDGWFILAPPALRAVGLEDRKNRAKAAKRLIDRNILETRQPSAGTSLEYRLRPVAQWLPPP
jgi:hypothetical protein